MKTDSFGVLSVAKPKDESKVVIMAQTAAELLIEHGKAEGRQASILQLLRIRFQNVPETLTERITCYRKSLTP